MCLVCLIIVSIQAIAMWSEAQALPGWPYRYTCCTVASRCSKNSSQASGIISIYIFCILSLRNMSQKIFRKSTPFFTFPTGTVHPFIFCLFFNVDQFYLCLIFSLRLVDWCVVFLNFLHFSPLVSPIKKECPIPPHRTGGTQYPRRRLNHPPFPTPTLTHSRSGERYIGLTLGEVGKSQ